MRLGSGKSLCCLLALFVSGVLGSGCATTTGLAWVREPESGGLDAESTGFDAPSFEYPRGASAAPPRAQTSDVVETPDDAAAPRHRLRHTVSLGESAAELERPAEAARSGAGTDAPRGPIVITINNYIETAGSASTFASDDFRTRVGRGHTRRGDRARARPAQAPRVGGDWPAPPSYGPAFPYRTAPASPWEPAR